MDISMTLEEASIIGNAMGLDWSRFSPEEFRMGLITEMEHGTRYSDWNITNNDLFMTAKIVLAHLEEFTDYYTRLKQMEEQAKAEGSGPPSPPGLGNYVY